MVRITTLQWCSDLELARKCDSQFFLLGRNLGLKVHLSSMLQNWR